MANEDPNGFPQANPPNDGLPKIKSIFDFTAESLEELAVWLEQRGLTTPVSQVVGYQQTTQSARVTHSVDQSIANNAATIVAFDTDIYDVPDNLMHDTVTNNSRITIRVAGRYYVGTNVSWESNATGERQVALLLNGATIIGSDQRLPVSGNTTAQNVGTIYDLVVGDYVEVRALQVSGGALNIRAISPHTPSFVVARV